MYSLPFYYRATLSLSAVCRNCYSVRPSTNRCSPQLTHRQLRVLRSSTSDLLATQLSSTNIAARRFSRCAPTVWKVFPHLYALLTVSLVFSSQLKTYDVRKTSAVRAFDTFTRTFVRYKFVTCLLTYACLVKMAGSIIELFLSTCRNSIVAFLNRKCWQNSDACAVNKRITKMSHDMRCGALSL